MIKRLIIALVALILIGGGLIGFNLFRDNMIRQIFANLPVQVMPVTTVTVQPTTWQPGISAIGTVNAAQGIDLTVEAPGLVREIAFAANQKVAQGDLLVRLDDVTQEADVQSAKSQLEVARTALDRARALQRRGVTSDANLEGADANLRSAEAAVARAEVSLSTRRLTAPFGGTIGLPRIDPGSYVTPGQVIATLQDLEQMRVDFSLPEQELPHLAIGQKLSVELDGGGDSYPGEVTGIDPRVDAASRMVALRGTISGTEGALTPGQFVRITLSLPVEDGAIALPQTAVLSSLYGDYVYAVRDSGEKDDQGQPKLEARQVFVTPGRRAAGLVEITGTALKPGDIIITGGQNRLSNGAPVRIDNTVTPDGQGQTPPPATEPATAPGGTTEAAPEDATDTAPAIDTDTEAAPAAEKATTP
ncbi:efflux RND transporter periplasmic adaptor subunit [Paracoccus sp. p3-h83]|uniref:efflux RND transporter periplasmic adaptor subunit n=1 Tax=Paracoccus sp. p3-h83 TaxID=3342805 RepID=UPI0035B8C5B4